MLTNRSAGRLTFWSFVTFEKVKVRQRPTEPSRDDFATRRSSVTEARSLSTLRLKTLEENEVGEDYEENELVTKK